MGRRPTMDDVARESGCSRALVSIVFRGVPGASDATRERVLGAARRIGYQHNAIAARLASTRSRTFGVFLFDIRNGMTAGVFAGIQDEVDARDIGLVVGVSDPTGVRDERTMSDLLAAHADVVILIAARMSGARLRQVVRVVPLVSATRWVSGVDSVVCDDEAGAGLLVDHLTGLGHDRIVMMAPPWRSSARVAGYRAAMERAGLAPRILDVGHDHDAATAATLSLLAETEPPTAIMAHNDVMACSVLDAAAACGTRVPEELAVTGYDDLPQSATHMLSLTSVDQHAYEIGRRSVIRACSLLDGTDEGPLPALTPVLVPRGSTAARATADRTRRGAAR